MYFLKNVMIVFLLLFASTSFAEEYLGEDPMLHLPYNKGWSVRVTQGNGGTVSHTRSEQYALDFSLNAGDPVYSSDGGVVYLFPEGSDNPAPKWGNHVKVMHGFLGGAHKYTVYAHLSSIDPDLVNGSEIYNFTRLGEVGSTGNSGADHLHWGLYSSLYYPGDHKQLVSDGVASSIYGRSVKSRIFVGHQGIGPVNVIDSTDFIRNSWYLSENGLADDEIIYCGNEAIDVLKHVECVVAEGSNGTGGSILPDPSGTPWDGYDHHVGIDYVKLCRKKDKDCASSMDVTPNNLPTHDLRVKLKRKGDYWKDVNVYTYCSNDRDFGDDDDILLGSEDKQLTKEKYKHKKKKSVYIENLDLSSCVTQFNRNYYLFAVVHYDGGKNPSTENDGSEHVQMRARSVVTLPTVMIIDPETELPEFCNTLSNLRTEIANLQKSYNSHYAQERYYRDREKHYRSQYDYNRSKYKHYKKKYKKKRKSKYKKKYKKYRARAKRNKEKYQKADRDKNWFEAEKHRIGKVLEKKRDEELQCN